MNILVTGGLGYIGAHTVKALLAKKHKVLIIDNLENGNTSNLIKGAILLKTKLNDTKALIADLKQNRVDAVFHFAALKAVGDSMKEPLKYYKNNVGDTLSLLEAMQQSNVKYLIFSSTAAVYGQPETGKVKESDSLRPINPYGKSKKMIEVILKDVSSASNLRYVTLRYFNVAGYDNSGRVGVREKHAKNLIPVIINSVLDKTPLNIFGQDYPTKDGTPIRDYIHVTDLVDAHLKALDHLIKTNSNEVFNLGNNRGYSVKDILKATEKGLKIKLNIIYGPRRPGDPAMLIADSSKARKVLKWTPKYGLEEMIKSTYQVFKKTN
jgi:UDP-glucose 4-epimerase